MLKRNATILLIGLMCFSSASGFFTVICHGSDGHVEVEAASHNHCPCPENGDNDQKNTPADHHATAMSASHGHCKDTLLTSNVVVPVRKKVSQSVYKIFTANISLDTNTAPAASTFSPASQSYILTPFHAPLRTVILLS